MNVLLILGNGFDLNLALPTSYSNFYDYYLYNDGVTDDTGTNGILKRSLLDWKYNDNSTIKEIIDWSDLELALGELTKLYQQPDDFLKATEDIEDSLAKYLALVDKLEISDLSMKARKFIEDIVKVTALTDFNIFINQKNDWEDAQYYFDNQYFERMRQFVRSYTNRHFLDIDIMSFNYTHTVERILEEANKNLLVPEKIRVNNIFHIHQELNELGILIGVNDISQVKNLAFQNDSELNSLFIKPRLIGEFASGVDRHCIQAIERADVIVLFGLSLGKTDSVWWSRIGNISAGNHKRIIYCPYETDFDYKTKHIVSKNKKLVRYVLDRFKESGASHDSLSSLVYPLRKNQLFHFDSAESLKTKLCKNHNSILDQLLPPDRPF